MRTALIYDRINKFGGAERLLLALTKLFPNAPLFTLVHEPKTSSWAKDIKVIPTFINVLPFLRKRHEWLAPFGPLAFESLDLSAYDCLISVTSGDAKSIITRPHQIHICYCLTPTRYFWSGADEYEKDVKMSLLPNFLKEYFRKVDLLISSRPDAYIAISNEVKKRIKKYYNRESAVVFPPIDDIFYSQSFPVPMYNREYFLAVGRLVPYKKFAMVVSVFNKLNLPLVVIGEGSEKEYLTRLAGPKVSVIGTVDDSRLIEFYRHARAVIFPQEEDFGLIPLEAQALGTPVIAFADGGVGDTVIHGQTGYLFEKQTEEALANAVKKFMKMTIFASDCQKNAARFSFKKFEKSFKKEINKLTKQYKQI